MAEYSSVLESVRTAVNYANPMGLFPWAPDDEYKPEIADLTRRIVDMGDPISSTTVTAVFRHWFGTRIPVNTAETVAVLIQELLPAA